MQKVVVIKKQVSGFERNDFIFQYYTHLCVTVNLRTTKHKMKSGINADRDVTV
jgi:hypothetical protein